MNSRLSGIEAGKRPAITVKRRFNGNAAKGRVLLVGNFLSATLGNHNVCEGLAERLGTLGWKVITASDKPGRLRRLFDMAGTAWRRRHEYSVAHVDVYSGLAFDWAEAVCWTLRRAGKPYVLTLHGGNLPSFARRWPGRVKHLFQSAAAITTPSGYLLEQMSPYRADLLLLPNPLNISSYKFRLRERPRPRLIWLRAFQEMYNPSLTPKVIARLAPEFPDVHLTMIGHDKGDGSFQDTQRSIRELKISDRVQLTGGVPKTTVADWLQKGDIFLNTSNVDNTPISVLEAMANGLCVVSTGVGGVPYLLEDKHDALLVPPDNSEAMADAVRRILTEEGLAKRLSQNGRKKVEQFDWLTILPQWEKLLTIVAERRVAAGQ
jgi:glycosyltransferase involved in cell wall biosynthesis